MLHFYKLFFISYAHEFSIRFKELLETAKQQDCRALHMLTKDSLAETRKIREFKTAGTMK